MKDRRSRRTALVPLREIAMCVGVLVLDGPAFADIINFRVGLEDVPGVEQIEAGNLDAGINTLEDQLEESQEADQGPILTTLCAAYIVNGSFTKAERVCDEAVSADSSDTAYNNRGVFRAFSGDFSGARRDFDRVRPQEMDVYLEELKKKDVPLMADDNFILVDDLMRMRKDSTAEFVTPVAIRTASIENVSD